MLDCRQKIEELIVELFYRASEAKDPQWVDALRTSAAVLEMYIAIIERAQQSVTQ